MTHYVYVIAAKKRHIVKIGRSANPQGRLNTLRTGQHEVIELRHTYRFENESTAASVEIAVHRALASERLSGEWFAISATKALAAIRAAASLSEGDRGKLIGQPNTSRCKCNPWDGRPSLDCALHKDDPGAGRLRKCRRCWEGEASSPRCPQHGVGTSEFPPGT